MSEPRRRPTTMSTCPFCSSPQEFDKLHTRFYDCGTTADRDSGNYDKKCGGRNGMD